MLTVLMLALGWSFGQVTLEDFEDGGKFQWNNMAGDSTLTIVDNPAVADTTMDPLNLNRSAKAGSYTKVAGRGYSLLITTLPAPLDLSTNNKFTVQVFAAKASKVLLKLEGGGKAIEQTKNIAVTNRWIEYTFDFSAAASFTTLDKIILFFDPGVDASSDTYLFDNLRQWPADECAGTVAQAGMIDDFECQRNATYGSPGYLDIAAVANPDASGINTSAKVGKYTDGPGPWHAMVIDYDNDIDLNARNIVKIKVWAPVAGRLLFKLEGGSSPAKEKDAQITELNKWVEYSADFGDQAGASHKKLVFFFNAGVDVPAGDVYYIDDIQIVEAPKASSLEDFEGGPKMTWSSLGQEAIFGKFNGAIANPDKTDPNTSDEVGSYTKGTSALGGLKADLPLDFSLATFPQIDLQVWAPEGANSLTMKLFSATEGLKEVKQAIAETKKWVQLNFNFISFQSITDFERVELVFDDDLATTDTWYFDNLSQGVETVDPCADIASDPTYVDNFDCSRNIEITGGLNQLKIVNNPDPKGINPDPLDKVGEYTDPNDAWSALVFNYGDAIDLSYYNQLKVKIWSPKMVPLLFKLEGGQGVEEVFANVVQAESWVEYKIDFSPAMTEGHTRLAIFFNAGQEPGTATDKYYIDDVQWSPAPFKTCIADFETPTTTFKTWGYFGHGNDADLKFAVIPNPDPSGVNTSDSVGVAVETAGGQVWAGMFVDLPAPMLFPDPANKTMRAKIWMDHPAKVIMKLEQGTNPGSTGDVPSDYTDAGKWQELTWDFSAFPADNNFKRVTLIFDIENSPTADKTYYFDDITIGDADCAGIPNSILRPVVVDALQIAPNPVRDVLTLQNAAELDRVEIYNMLGQRVQVINTNREPNPSIEVSSLDKGMYLLAGFNRSKGLVANAKFVKE